MTSIRCKAVGLPVRDGHVLVHDGIDRLTGERYYRAIGGSIDPGETAEAAIRREFMEELGIALEHVEKLDVLENLFTFEGQLGHEIVFVFAVDAPAFRGFALDEERKILDADDLARWVPIVGHEHPIYPAGIEVLLSSLP